MPVTVTYSNNLSKLISEFTFLRLCVHITHLFMNGEFSPNIKYVKSAKGSFEFRIEQLNCLSSFRS